MNVTIRRAPLLALAGLLALVFGMSPASARQDSTPAERLEAIVARMREATNEYYKENWKDDLDEELKSEIVANRPGPEFVPEFEALALEAKGTDVCASALMEVLSIHCDFQKKEEAVKTLERLLAESIGSKALKDLPMTLMYSYSRMAGQERVNSTLETLLEKSPHKEVKASALFTLGQIHCRGDASDTQKAKGRKCFERLIAEFGDVKGNRKPYKEAAQAFLFELDHLQIGMLAPDFESIDENGAKFKLSDYRGKVVVIDFWGNW